MRWSLRRVGAVRPSPQLRRRETAVWAGQALDDADGGLAPEQIAEILDTDELAVTAHEPPTEISVGDD